MSKCIGNGFNFTMYFDWFEIKNNKLLCDAFYLIKTKPYYWFASIGICLQDSPHFQIHFCIKTLQPVEIKEPKMTFFGRTTLCFI